MYFSSIYVCATVNICVWIVWTVIVFHLGTSPTLFQRRTLLCTSLLHFSRLQPTPPPLSGLWLKKKVWMLSLFQNITERNQTHFKENFLKQITRTVWNPPNYGIDQKSKSQNISTWKDVCWKNLPAADCPFTIPATERRVHQNFARFKENKVFDRKLVLWSRIDALPLSPDVLTLLSVKGTCYDLYLHSYWNLCCVRICVVFVFVFSFAEQSRVLGARSAAVRHLRVTRSLDCDLPPIPTNPSLNTRHHEPACPRWRSWPRNLKGNIVWPRSFLFSALW